MKVESEGIGSCEQEKLILKQSVIVNVGDIKKKKNGDSYESGHLVILVCIKEEFELTVKNFS